MFNYVYLCLLMFIYLRVYVFIPAIYLYTKREYSNKGILLRGMPLLKYLFKRLSLVENVTMQDGRVRIRHGCIVFIDALLSGGALPLQAQRTCPEAVSQAMRASRCVYITTDAASMRMRFPANSCTSQEDNIRATCKRWVLWQLFCCGLLWRVGMQAGVLRLDTEMRRL